MTGNKDQLSVPSADDAMTGNKKQFCVGGWLQYTLSVLYMVRHTFCTVNFFSVSLYFFELTKTQTEYVLNQELKLESAKSNYHMGYFWVCVFEAAKRSERKVHTHTHTHCSGVDLCVSIQTNLPWLRLPRYRNATDYTHTHTIHYWQTTTLAKWIFIVVKPTFRGLNGVCCVVSNI